MSRILGTKDKNAAISVKHKCMFCNGTPTGFWQGDEHNIKVCRSCAVNVLPALIADATFTESQRDITGDEKTLETVERVFWKANASAVRHWISEEKREKAIRDRFEGKCEGCEHGMTMTEYLAQRDRCFDCGLVGRLVDDAGVRCSMCMTKHMNSLRIQFGDCIFETLVQPE